MKKLKKIVMSAVVSMLVFSTCFLSMGGLKTEAKTKESSKITASQQYAEDMQPGWNLGNSFDSFDTNGDKGETSWGNPVVTKSLIDKIKSQGFKSIRIPFTSVMRTGVAPTYTIDPAFLARYAEVVKWALDDGLYVMINLHHDSWSWASAIGSPSDNGASLEKYKAIWTQLADYFKNYSNKVCFESLNEPQFYTGDTANQIKILEQVNSAFYNIVRNSGGKNAARMLVLPTLNTNDSDDRCESLYNTITSLKDKNIIATFHYYGYWPFSTNIAGSTTMDSTVTSALDGAFDRMYNHFTANGIGVICGEYGLLGFDKSEDTLEHGEMLKYFDYINYYAKAKKITLMLWDNGNILNRSNLTWYDQSLYDTIRSSWKGRNSYSSSDRIYVTDASKAQDISTAIILNGNKLKSIHNGDKKLKLGRDYTYSNGTVTFKGSYINSLITNSYGVNATLTIRFSHGADWTVYINHYKTPTLASADGTTSGFNIPVSFNGSRLSTLEAMYTDGSGVGPQNWTTYKEYNYAFKVNYDLNQVTMTDKFFAETKDGTILLKLHFQSGEVLQYNIIKNGTSVTGTLEN